MQTWGGDVEINALASAKQVHVTVYQPHDGFFCFGEPSNPNINIAFNDRGHYYAVINNESSAFIHNLSALRKFAAYHKANVPLNFPQYCAPPVNLLLPVPPIVPENVNFLPTCLLPASIQQQLHAQPSRSVDSPQCSNNQVDDYIPSPLSSPTDLQSMSVTDNDEPDHFHWESLREDLAAILSQRDNPVCQTQSLSEIPDFDVCAIANHPPINSNIHVQNRPLWTSCVREVLKVYLACDSSSDPTTQMSQKLSCILKLLMLPGHLLALTKRKKKKNKSINHQRVILLGLLDAIPSLQPNQKSSQLSTRATSNADSNKFAIARAKRVESLVSQGYLGHAANVWCQSSGLADLSSNQAIEELRKLHPSCESQLPAPHAMANTTPPTILDSTDLTRLVKSMDTGSAPGPSGWTVRLIRMTLHDEICCQGFTKLINDIIHNKLPPQAKQFLLACNLVASPKTNGGLRPIAIAEIFHRLAAKAAINSIIDLTGQIWNNIQLGINVSGGVEAAVHLIHMNLTHRHPVLNCDLAALPIDFKNAFKEIDRAEVLKAVYANPVLSPIWPMVDFSYSSPSHLLTRDSVGKPVKALLSQQGVRQGDPLASFLFALTIQPMYDLVSRQPGIEAVAIHDDLTLTGKPESLVHVFLVVTEQAAKLGLKVQPRESQFIYFKNDSNPLSREVTDRLVELDIKLQTDDAIVLGCPIAKDNITLHRALSKSIHSIIESINSCMADSTVSSQSAILLLRSCFAQKIDYLMRCLGPSAFKGLESKFHANLIDSVLALPRLASILLAQTTV
jgi:hypothetical protein